MSQTNKASIPQKNTPEEYQKQRAEAAMKEIAKMPKLLPGQFKSQCERLKAQSTQNRDK